MQVEQCHWTADSGWRPRDPGGLDPHAELVLAFGSRSALECSDVLGRVRRAYPGACVIGGSTSGEIFGTRVLEGSLVTTAIRMSRTRVQAARVALDEGMSSAEAGRRLARQLAYEDLAHVLVVSDGLRVNGSELVNGMLEALPDSVTVTGGMAGDGECFRETLLVWQGCVVTRTVLAVGFYGDRFRVGYGSVGGWDPFGPDRLITRSEGNVLYELDGKSALSLYKQYLGAHAEGLPATGLLFPLALRQRNGDPPVVRTILSVDESEQSMTFAGDVPQGAVARLMKANFDRLIDGAANAARISVEGNRSGPPDVALLISCVGRKMVLQQRVEEEVEAVRDVLGPQPVLAGFYSYGEISPFSPGARCMLHNQTMTITTLHEG